MQSAANVHVDIHRIQDGFADIQGLENGEAFDVLPGAAARNDAIRACACSDPYAASLPCRSAAQTDGYGGVHVRRAAASNLSHDNVH